MDVMDEMDGTTDAGAIWCLKVRGIFSGFERFEASWILK